MRNNYNISSFWIALHISLLSFCFSVFRRMDRSPFPVLMGRQMIRQSIMATRRRTHRLMVCAHNHVLEHCVYISLSYLYYHVCVHGMKITDTNSVLPPSVRGLCVRLKMWSLSFYLCALFPQLNPSHNPQQSWRREHLRRVDTNIDLFSPLTMVCEKTLGQ